jgi:hypothetical protein
VGSSTTGKFCQNSPRKFSQKILQKIPDMGKVPQSVELPPTTTMQPRLGVTKGRNVTKGQVFLRHFLTPTLCQSAAKCVKVWQGVSNCVKLCQSVSNCIQQTTTTTSQRHVTAAGSLLYVNFVLPEEHPATGRNSGKNSVNTYNNSTSEKAIRNNRLLHV